MVRYDWPVRLDDLLLGLHDLPLGLDLPLENVYVVSPQKKNIKISRNETQVVCIEDTKIYSEYKLMTEECELHSDIPQPPFATYFDDSLFGVLLDDDKVGHEKNPAIEKINEYTEKTANDKGMKRFKIKYSEYIKKAAEKCVDISVDGDLKNARYNIFSAILNKLIYKDIQEVKVELPGGSKIFSSIRDILSEIKPKEGGRVKRKTYKKKNKKQNQIKKKIKE
jgi:hypothetical protein